LDNIDLGILDEAKIGGAEALEKIGNLTAGETSLNGETKEEEEVKRV
jgi:hypothetical protein